MKVTTLVGVFAIAVATMSAETRRPDFYARNPDGTVRLHGVYQTDPNGRVTKYTVYDGAEKLQYTEVPYYAPDGRIIRADHFGADGKLTKVVVYFDKVLKVFSPTGELLDTQGFSQDEFLRAQKS